MLAGHPSEDKEADIETIAEACVNCFKAQNLWKADRNAVTAEFWVRAFCKHVEGLCKDGPCSDSQYVALVPFPKFIGRSLLQHADVFPLLVKFTEPLEKLEQRHPKLFPEVGLLQALYVLAKADPSVVDELPLDNLSLQLKHKLVQSPLWSAFEAARLEAQVVAVRSSKDPTAARLTEVERLLHVKPDDSRLLLGRTDARETVNVFLTIFRELFAFFPLGPFWAMLRILKRSLGFEFARSEGCGLGHVG